MRPVFYWSRMSWFQSIQIGMNNLFLERVALCAFGMDFVGDRKRFYQTIGKIMKYAVLTVAALALPVVSVSGSIVVSPEVDPLGSLTSQTLMGSEGVAVGNAWWRGIDGGDAVFSYWANQPIVFSSDLDDGDWRVGLTVRNKSALPEWYNKFAVDIYVDDVFQSTVELPAIQDEYRTTWFDIGQQNGETDLKLVWTNDFWDPGVYDANIVIGAVQFGQVVPAAPTAGVFALAGLAAMRRRR